MSPLNSLIHSVLLSYFIFVHGMEYRVRTKVGEIIGHIGTATFNGSNTRVLKFLGIPYAVPPLGDLRFSKTRRLSNFQAPFNASAFGPGCPQDSFLSSMWIPGPNIYDEDCLFLNIFVPFKDHAEPNPNISNYSLPVMIWIHGGAYMIGQSSMYSGDVISGFRDIIVVTINYRLGALGFLTTGDEVAPGNNGLWDQHIAIQWVHENIQYFGGDPDVVTLFGNSAGASSTIYHALYSGNKGLFKRVIAQSGSPLSAWAYVERNITLKDTKRFAEKLNCSTSSSKEIIKCLRKLSYQDIVRYSKVGTRIETISRPEWCPISDGQFIQQYPPHAIRNPLSIPKNSSDVFSDVDVMIGVSSGDGGFIAQFSYIPFIQDVMNTTNMTSADVIDKMFVPLLVHDQYGVRSDVLRDTFSFVYNQQNHPNDGRKYQHIAQDISTDVNFAVSAFFTALDHEMLKRNTNTYLFRFSHLSSFNQPRPQWMLGANHGDELPYVFGFPPELAKGFGYINNTTPEEIELSAAFMTYWTNFAKTGNPNEPLKQMHMPQWPHFNSASKEYLDLDIPLKVRDRMFSLRQALWTALVPKLLKDISQGLFPIPTEVTSQPPYHGWMHLGADIADDIILGLATFSGVLLVVLISTCYIKIRSYRSKHALIENMQMTW